MIKKALLAGCVAMGTASLWASPSALQPQAEVTASDGNTTVVEVKKEGVVTRGDVKIIEATENIRFLSQQMAKEYLYLFLVPNPEEAKGRLKELLITLADNLRSIAVTTKDQDTKDILEFLSYSKDQIAQIFTEKVNEENAALMLDYSETLLEGADSIAAAHAYEFTKEEHMLIITKKMEYLIERIMKYYAALHVGFDTPTNESQMREAIAKFDENMKSIESYEYPEEIVSVEREIVRAWRANKVFLSRSKALFIPKLMLLSTESLESLTAKIALYHNQNQ